MISEPTISDYSQRVNYYKGQVSKCCSWILGQLQYPMTLHERETHISGAMLANIIPRPQKFRGRIKWDSYFITVMIGVITTVIQMNFEECVAFYAKTIDAECPPGLPQDGSTGQWRVARDYKVQVLSWFLNPNMKDDAQDESHDKE